MARTLTLTLIPTPKQVSRCDPAEGCDRYRASLFTTLVDMPGYLIGSLLADAVGRRTTASLSLLVAGGALLLSPNSDPNPNADT